MIKLETLRVFVRVADMGNIKDASNSLGRTPSAVSMSLKQLEEEIGGRLFETDRKNTLTALGSFVLEMAEPSIENFDKSISKIKDFAANRMGQLSIASVPSVAANLLPQLLPEFVSIAPKVEFVLRDIDSRSVRTAVENGSVDLGFAGNGKHADAIGFTPLFKDRFKIVCQKDSPLAEIDRPLKLSELKDENLILNGASNSIDKEEYKLLAENASLNVRNVTSLFALARSGIGITLLPSLATHVLPQELVALEIADSGIDRVVGLLEHRGTTLSPIAMAFKTFVLKEMVALIHKMDLQMVED